MNKRVEDLSDLLKRLIEGEQTEGLETIFKRDLKSITANELAEAENLLVDSGFSVEDIQRANQLHTDLVADHIKDDNNRKILDLESGHPAKVFVGENKGIREFISDRLLPDLEAFLNSKEEKNRLDLASDAEEISKVIKHYDRKENLLFPYLEENGITTPPKVMWGVDDIIRQLIGLFKDAVNQEPADGRRIGLIADRLIPQIEGMIKKENEILMPMVMPYMTEEDWLLCAKESVHIGLVFNKGIEGASNSDAATWVENHRETSLKGTKEKQKDEINLPSGYLNTEQMTAMLNTLPTDLTFIDNEDIIRYYSEGKHQVFTRTRTIIGRNVYLCHPPKLVPVIKKLIDDFKAGRKDAEIVPVRRGSRIDLVRYYAVRDDSGTYIGTLEVTEEISGILELLKE